jgi:Thiol-disulfide isomerase and thioredoxins
LAAGVVAVLLAGLAAACHRPPSCTPTQHVKLDYTLKDMNGHDVSLASYRGRPVLINFWATWCGPCKEEIPALVDLAGKYKRVAVLGISVDDTQEDLRKFAAANKINYPLLTARDRDEVLDAFDAYVVVPVSWVVASNGCPLAKREGGATRDWFEKQMKAAL